MCIGAESCLHGFTLWSLGSWLGGSWVSALWCFAYAPADGHLFMMALVLFVFRWPALRWHTSCYQFIPRAPWCPTAFPLLFCLVVVWRFCFFLFVFLALCWCEFCNGTSYSIDYEGLPLLSFAALTFVMLCVQQIHFQQVTACVTTWRKPRRRGTEKKTFGGLHLRLPSRPAGIRTYQLSHRVAFLLDCGWNSPQVIRDPKFALALKASLDWYPGPTLPTVNLKMKLVRPWQCGSVCWNLRHSLFPCHHRSILNLQPQRTQWLQPCWLVLEEWFSSPMDLAHGSNSRYILRKLLLSGTG